MTWTFDSHESVMDVYDHNDDLVASDVGHAGWGRRGFPREVLDVMYQAAVDEYQSNGGMNVYVLQTLAEAATEQIEER